MNRSVWVVLAIASLVLTLSGCHAYVSGTAVGAVSCTEVRHDATGDTSPHDSQQTGIEYFLSAQRKQQMQGLVDCIGGDYLRRMMEGDIKYVTVTTSGTRQAIRDGYGYVMTEYGSDLRSLVVKILVHFRDGRVDLQTGPLALSVERNLEIVIVNGRSILDPESETMIVDAPDAYTWSIFPLVEVLGFLFYDIAECHALFIADETTSTIPALDQPLDLSKGRYAVYTFGYGDNFTPATVDEIIAADEEVLQKLKSMGV